MKPIIVTKKADGTIDITEEQLGKIVEIAYDHGYADGLKFQSTPITVGSKPWWVNECETPKVTL